MTEMWYAAGGITLKVKYAEMGTLRLLKRTDQTDPNMIAVLQPS